MFVNETCEIFGQIYTLHNVVELVLLILFLDVARERVRIGACDYDRAQIPIEC